MTEEEIEAYRMSARAWLTQNAEPITGRDRWRNLKPTSERVEDARDWQKRKHAAGYACITWPKEFGGQSGSSVQQIIFAQEEAGFFTPRGVLEIGLGMCVPTLIQYGQNPLRQQLAQKAAVGEEIWCQLFSEPNAGSDLAGLSTKAEQSGKNWRVNGQKVWTSGAHYSKWGLLLARTDPTAHKHAGLTMFVVDMDSPGITVRPIRQMTGEEDFNEVFFTDVDIPDHQRLGEVGQGWSVALTTLMFERMSVGTDLSFLEATDVAKLSLNLKINGTPASQDQELRRNLARWHINERGLKILSWRAQEMLLAGGTPGPERSVSKLIAASQGQDMAHYVLAIMGDQAALDSAALDASQRLLERSWAWGAAMRIAGGTDEILRNIISERVLGLPQGPRPDLSHKKKH